MRIIAVDDESVILDEIKLRLSEYDPTACVEVFTDPKLALAAASCGMVDCALLDIEMLSAQAHSPRAPFQGDGQGSRLDDGKISGRKKGRI